MPAQAVRDAMMLAPTPGAPAAGSIDDQLAVIEGETSSIKSTVDTNLDATVSSRSTQTSIDAAAGDVTAIKAKTDQLNFTGTDVKATLDGEKVVVVTNEDKSGYSLAADQSGVTIGTVNDLGPAATSDVKAQTDQALVDYSTAKTSDVTSARDSVNANVDAVEAKVDDIKAKTDQINFTGTDVMATLDGEKVQVSGIDTDVITAASLAQSAVDELTAAIDSVLSAAHGTGAWDGIISSQALRDAMKLAPSAGSPDAGSLDALHNTTVSQTTAAAIAAAILVNPTNKVYTDNMGRVTIAPDAVVNSVWDVLMLSHGTPDTFGWAVNQILNVIGPLGPGMDTINAAVQSILTKIGIPYAIGGNAATLADNLRAIVDYTNGTSFNPALHSLRAIKEALPNLTHPPTYINPNGDIEEML